MAVTKDNIKERSFFQILLLLKSIKKVTFLQRTEGVTSLEMISVQVSGINTHQPIKFSHLWLRNAAKVIRGMKFLPCLCHPQIMKCFISLNEIIIFVQLTENG